MRLHDQHLVEDVVQETFISAIESRERYSNNCSLKTWLVAILKRKIADCIRKQSKEHTFGYEYEWAISNSPEKNKTDILNGEGPEAGVEKADFWRIIEQCVAHLPSKLSKVIILRELDGASVKEICKVLDTSTTNVWVMLHRARDQIRCCLNRRWFGI